MAVVHRFLGDDNSLNWADVPVHNYDTPGVTGASRRILIGPAEESHNFHIRYFEVQPGGNTALDQHAHAHGVVVMRGRGRVRLGDEEIEVGYGDVIYIPGHEIHQFFCLGEEPLGFLCVVRGKR